MSWNEYETLLLHIKEEHPCIWNCANYEIATRSNKISLRFWVVNYPDVLEKYIKNISLYSIMTIDDIVYYKDIINFDWTMISARDDITWDIVVLHPELPWCYCGLSQNKNMTMAIVHDNIDKPWDFCLLLQTIIFN